MRELRMANGRVEGAKESKAFMEEHAPECPECDATVHPRGKVGPSDYWVCENGHTFEEPIDGV